MEIIRIVSDGDPKVMSIETYIMSKTAHLQDMGYSFTEGETAKAIQDVISGLYDSNSLIHAMVAVDMVTDKNHITN